MSTYAYKILKDIVDFKITEEEGEKLLLEFFNNYWEPSENRRLPRDLELPKDKIYLLELYGDRCIFCNIIMISDTGFQTKLTSEDNLTIEHILPRSKGGPNHLDNKCLSCASCNSRKQSNIIPAINRIQKVYNKNTPFEYILKNLNKK